MKPISQHRRAGLREEGGANVADLAGAWLDYWVARAEGLEAPEVAQIETEGGRTREWCQYVHHYYAPDDDGWWTDYRPTSDWKQGGPIIEREDIQIMHGPGGWRATKLSVPHSASDGKTMLEAAMRAYVISRFGATIEQVHFAHMQDLETHMRICNRLRL